MAIQEYCEDPTWRYLWPTTFLHLARARSLQNSSTHEGLRQQLKLWDPSASAYPPTCFYVTLSEPHGYPILSDRNTLLARAHDQSLRFHSHTPQVVMAPSLFGPMGIKRDPKTLCGHCMRDDQKMAEDQRGIPNFFDAARQFLALNARHVAPPAAWTVTVQQRCANPLHAHIITEVIP